MVVNAGVDLTQLPEFRTILSGRSLQGGVMADATTQKALMIWFALLATEVMQVHTREIDIKRYLAGELAIEATMPAGPTSRALHEAAVRAFAQHEGLDADLLLRWQSGALSRRYLYDLLRSPGFGPRSSLPKLERAQLEHWIAEARSLPFQEWEKVHPAEPTS